MYPKVNQNIIIDIKSRDQSCRSIVAEVGAKEILISFPMDGNVVGLLLEGTPLMITFISGDNQYRFETEIIGRKKDKIPLFRIKKPNEKEIVKIQRRDNFRVNTSLRLLVNDYELITINISAGGVLFSCKEELRLQEGEVLSGTLFVQNMQNQELEPITFQGQIKRISLFKNQGRKNVAMQFIVMEQRDQMKIIQYCFEKQRQMRLKVRETK